MFSCVVSSSSSIGFITHRPSTETNPYPQQVPSVVRRSPMAFSQKQSMLHSRSAKGVVHGRVSASKVRLAAHISTCASLGWVHRTDRIARSLLNWTQALVCKAQATAVVAERPPATLTNDEINKVNNAR